ncbi:putative bifunctional diguanylate cyclase/phosphodiesterase [Methylophaga sp. OBS4]|uniref:putative bifunctional diguanylate cyclase/phosphodiesterase n=1 Tax=Methylophaga sp. OBS4 TaxID=2991935 RepID=UPI0022581B02|nr:bifunctional diguanylate cyclase/phosphodiesterase [Methylophaga sp. OBS4]MCX4188508.1 EAL domain-containing protein [Methylophaga sp. OBS4]
MKQIMPGLKVASMYGLFATLWIIFSDKAIDAIAVNKTMLSALQTWKGLLFVVVTTLLVFMLVQYYFSLQWQLIDELKQNQQRLNLILNTIPNGVQENDAEGRITYSNLAHHRILEYPQGSLIGHHIWDFQPDENEQQQLQDYIHYLVAHQPSPEPYITHNLTRVGRDRMVEVVWDYKRDNNGKLTGFISVISDITHEKEQEREILQLAYYDPLTNLPNRFRSLEHLASLLKQAKKSQTHLAVLVLDLDHFKKINDTLGHDIGDKLLKQVAERLGHCLHQQQVLGRLGGDEFIVMHRDERADSNLSTLTEALLDLFNSPFHIDKRELMLTASIGVAIYPNHGETVSELLRNADSAMFYAKDNGRNTHAYFTHAMNLDMTRRFEIEEQMHSALERGEFTLMYQPQVELNHGRIVGAEALLRWHNPVLGEIPPDEFISIAEQTTHILPIGRFVLEQSLRFTGEIQQRFDPDFRMAINLSPCQFQDYGLIKLLHDLIEQFAVKASQVELEITEGVLLSGSSLVGETLTKLTDMSISLAMDDFGTGYSSLSYLRSYPFDVLKIDRSFINNISSKPTERELINAIIAMSQALGLKVVAEGVETEEQMQFLQTIGCDYGQGYYFSKPLTEDALIKFLDKQCQVSQPQA